MKTAEFLFFADDKISSYLVPLPGDSPCVLLLAATAVKSPSKLKAAILIESLGILLHNHLIFLYLCGAFHKEAYC